MVFAYASEKDLRNKLDQVIDLCEDLKKEMTQDAIALEVNGEMFFIQQKQTIINGASHKRQAPINWRACNVSGI